jgi:hypothetical protein
MFKAVERSEPATLRIQILTLGNCLRYGCEAVENMLVPWFCVFLWLLLVWRWCRDPYTMQWIIARILSFLPDLSTMGTLIT